MKHYKRLAFIMAVMMVAALVPGIYTQNASAAGRSQAISFTSTNTGIEVGKSDEVKFTAQLDTPGVRGLYVRDENGSEIAKLHETSAGTYEATVTVSADKRASHTYSLNTSNSDEYTCEMNFFKPLTSEDTARDDRTWNNIKSISSTISASNKKSVLSSVYSTLKADSNVEKVWYESDTIINFITSDGVANVYDADLSLHKKTASADVSESETNVTASSSAGKYQMKADNSTIASKNICVIAPYYGVESDFTEAYLLEAENLKTAMGGTGTISAFYGNGSLTGKKGDISAFKNLDNYGIILVDSHGSLYNGQSLICVHYSSGASNADFSAKRVVRGEDYTGVLAAFITYYTKSLPNSIVHMGSCYGMHSSHLYSGFKSLGAGFVTGFSMSVSFVYEKQVFSEYAKKLRTKNPDTGKYHTTKEAFDASVARFTNTDPYGSERAVWKYSGNTNLVISDLHSPIAVTNAEISPKSAEMSIGETLQLTLTVEPAAALQYAQVDWSSFNEDIASVTNGGLVEALESGTTRIACDITDELGNSTALSAEITVIDSETYTVKFVDSITNETISTQQVQPNAAANAPEAPNHSGYVFSGWDKDFSNVTSDMTVNTVYFTLGDVNRDGVINTADATFILKYAAEIISFDDVQTQLADFNWDGKQNTADAVAILKSIVG